MAPTLVELILYTATIASGSPVSVTAATILLPEGF
jgi:hypothetical protein